MAENGTNRTIRLRQRPEGRIDDSTFEVVEEKVPEIGPGEALIRTLFLSIDPTNRVWISDTPSYLPPVGIGEVMRAGGVGRVVASNTDKFAEGDLVNGLTGWQDYVVAAEQDGVPFTRIPKELNVPPTMVVGLLGISGLTAWYGVEEIGKPKEGETFFVSAAAGSVGSIAGQIAKIHGARVVGSAGGKEKCDWLVEELGFDAAVDRHSDDWRKQLKQACPDGIDVDFENVGGEMMEAVFAMLNVNARVALCGLISSYNDSEPPPGPRSFGNLLTKRALLKGFIIIDFLPHSQQAAGQLAQWAMEGKIQDRHTVVDGLEKAPQAINMLFDGDNYGKLMVRVADDSSAAV
jgi:NADPH-dependent curcumin reductase CurA